ncbi:hypothetical protein R103_N20571 [Saccharomyces cerevisiae R103]|uniref:Putative uncharacterized protein YNL144W-A n=2 Tax=Saccharomyces cerevisiae TaxID=4932 RepID=YN144_YEAST|nr:RecName: Full=Putative uncharacterized protein YNL144W-A [Saccharomyces cerevisiae S288C]AAL79286.1 unknown [Saccharomyces cerevisiae]EWG93765.1 hypothetical protein R103_N20571 [Saccharomyces cerevisiae R103]KZV08478.1 hypothetical protein WN66_05394 [Saccharomyces cerevisiae]CAY82459.1 EC1118_1N9_2113p [Saccharomyces cerevisiae EC1118]
MHLNESLIYLFLETSCVAGAHFESLLD